MAVNFGLLSGSEVLAFLREHFLVSLACGYLVEPVTAGEGFLPDLSAAEFVEVFDPHVFVCS